ncbi:hypothetical protein NSB20_20775, partial [Bacteroides acidifaciens]|uniref:hypothetical protein n=1 Tax=Bacteroides acidifaciens TaxID=85831 RepID=UPI00214A724E
GRKQHTPVCNLFLQSDCERPTLICIAVTNVTAIPHSHGTLQGANLSIYIGSPLAPGIFFNDLIIKCLENKKEYSIFVASENG